MIKSISFPQHMKIGDIINLLEKFKDEQGGTMELQYAEVLCFKCHH